MMAKAFVFMRKKMVVYASDETIEQLAKDYEKAMKDVSEANKGKHSSEETKKKLSEEAKKCMRWFNNGKINVRARECPEGFFPGRIK